jgi:hypothetical protein
MTLIWVGYASQPNVYGWNLKTNIKVSAKGMDSMLEIAYLLFDLSLLDPIGQRADFGFLRHLVRHVTDRCQNTAGAFASKYKED